jgi:hypothetical protein
MSGLYLSAWGLVIGANEPMAVAVSVRRGARWLSTPRGALVHGAAIVGLAAASLLTQLPFRFGQTAMLFLYIVIWPALVATMVLFAVVVLGRRRAHWVAAKTPHDTASIGDRHGDRYCEGTSDQRYRMPDR